MPVNSMSAFLQSMLDRESPRTILVSKGFAAAVEGEVARTNWLALGANWRRAKREGRKVRERIMRRK